jgi:hypothetical protein
VAARRSWSGTGKLRSDRSRAPSSRHGLTPTKRAAQSAARTALDSCGLPSIGEKIPFAVFGAELVLDKRTQCAGSERR